MMRKALSGRVAGMNCAPTGLARAADRRCAFAARLVTALVLMAFFAVSAPAFAAPPPFGVSGEGAGEMVEPLGIAVEQQTGEVILVDSRNSRLEAWTEGGVFLRASGEGVVDGAPEFQICEAECGAGLVSAGGGAFGERPEGVAVDSSLGASQGDVYVGDPLNHRIEQFAAGGAFLAAFGGEVNETKVNTPGATQAERNVCTVASGDTCKAGVPGVGPGEFEELGGDSVAVDSVGTVYVAGRERVQELSSSGAFEGEMTMPPGTGHVEALAVDSSKDLYVTLSGAESTGVFKFAFCAGVCAPSQLGRQRDSGRGFFEDLAVGPAGELFVDDQQEQEVLGYTPEGEQTFSLAEPEGRGGLAFASKSSTLYVLHPGFVQPRSLPAPLTPVVENNTEQTAEITPTSASLSATINPEGADTEYHFEYGTTTAYGESTPLAPPLTAINEVQSVRVAATGGGFTLSFKSEPSTEIPFNATAPEVQSALEGIAALGAGQVAVTGEAGGPWTVEFTGTRGGEDVPELNASASGLSGPEPGAAVATATQGVSLFADRGVSAAIAGLSPSTMYHFRVVATNGSQTTDGPDQTFTTLPAIGISDEAASQVTASSARLGASLNPNGVATEYRFEYGTTTEYGSMLPTPDAQAGAGTKALPVSVLVEHLAPGITYHYRVVAHTGTATDFGPDRQFTTDGAGSQRLIDGRVWEQVSPVDKHGTSLEAITEEGGVIQAAEDGGGLTYIAHASITEEPAGNRSVAVSQLIAKRASAGWTTSDVTTPHEEVVGLSVGSPAEYQVFSSDLSASVLEPFGKTSLSPRATERTPYEREANGTFVPIVYPGDVPFGTKFGGTESQSAPGVFIGDVKLEGASEDAKHVIVSSPAPLVEGLKPEGIRSLFEWTGGHLELVSKLPDGHPAAEDGLGSSKLGQEKAERQVRGAVSRDGSRVFFTAATHLFVYDRELGESVQVDSLEAGARGGAGAAVFQLATPDGAKVFFTDSAKLTRGATAVDNEPDLYMCEVTEVGGKLACRLTDLTPAANPANPGEPADLLDAVIGADDAGNYVYYVANGALATGAAHGGCSPAAEPFQQSDDSPCNLYVEDTVTRQVTFVAPLSGRDAGDWGAKGLGGDLGSVTSKVSQNGEWLAFMSDRPLTGFDNVDLRSGARDQEVFLYRRSSDQLTCVSCATSGERPTGTFHSDDPPGLLVDRPRLWANETLAGSIPGWTRAEDVFAFYQSRYLSNEGRLFFNSAVSLVPQDSNGTMDVYEFEPDDIGDCKLAAGCIGLVSSGESAEESAFLDASADGNDVFFLTSAPLARSDTDTALDIYDAHVCSADVPCASEAPSSPGPCDSIDRCREASPSMVATSPPTEAASGPGNVTPAPAPAPATKSSSSTHKKLTRAQLLKKALASCERRRQKRKRQACVRTAQRRYERVKGGHHA
jgi:hypothetical protein